jgi:DDE domain
MDRLPTVKLYGKLVYMWPAVDHEVEILESYITKARDTQSSSVGSTINPREKLIRQIIKYRRMQHRQLAAKLLTSRRGPRSANLRHDFCYTH